jgi:GDP-L-fucose synthase
MEQFMLDKSAPFYVAGHRGMAGGAIWKKLEAEGFTNLIGKASDDLDLRDRSKVFNFFRAIKPKYVVVAAAKVGGILANDSYPVEFLSQNLQIQANVMDAALEQGVERLVFLGSSCIYPKYAPQPMKEEYLLTGPLEPTNDAYAIAKIAGIKHVQAVRKQFGKAWISVIPTNLYGPGDNYIEGESHVMAALIRRFTEAKAQNLESVTNWGTGQPLREFLHVDDLADSICFMLKRYDSDLPINIGTGDELSIRELAELVCELTQFEGSVVWDLALPDGTPRKKLDCSRANQLGWRPKKTLRVGLMEALRDYKSG